MAIPNVIDLKKQSQVYEDIMGVIANISVNSENTQKEYKRDIRDFFQIMRNKDLAFLTQEDLIFDNIKIGTYQNILINKCGYAPSSAVRKINSVKGIYKKLEGIDRYGFVKSAWFNIVKRKGKTKSHAVVDWATTQKMIEAVLPTRKGLIKANLIEMAFRTSFREAALLRIEWTDIKRVDGVYVVEVMDKGEKLDRKPISCEFYDKLVQMKEEYGDKDGKLFDFSERSIVEMMKFLREELGLDDDVKFHSFKKGGIDEVYEITGGDIDEMRKQGNHASPATTLKHYRNKKSNVADMPCLQIGKSIDISKIHNLSKEQLIEIISGCTTRTKLEIMNKIGKTIL